jgi:hypothetical protein
MVFRNGGCILTVLLLASPAAAQVTSVIVPSLPSLGDEGKDAHDPDAIYCRPPQAQSDSRMPGPKTCKTNREWDRLHAQGLDIGADGRSVVASEKYRNMHGEGITP